jgi:hypothetical protein
MVGLGHLLLACVVEGSFHLVLKFLVHCRLQHLLRRHQQLLQVLVPVECPRLCREPVPGQQGNLKFLANLIQDSVVPLVVELGCTDRLVRTDGGRLKECLCALIGTLYDYYPSSQAKSWWPSTAQIGTKLVYLQSPEPVLYVVPLSLILGKLPLVAAGDDSTIPWNMHGSKAACYPRGVCDRQGSPGSGSPLFYINSWAMIWPVDYKKVE